ncbi:UNVERIFIED_CONTAM: Allene oxide synthase 1, chloroplastic [Sesamum angustifolium]|uniref:Allene oxide synthase 1, chloroplastic n=1 Tax=Sesamum angustifolium TaxID=2727405 RepID=A0AAW2K9E8_9LAMI
MAASSFPALHFPSSSSSQKLSTRLPASSNRCKGRSLSAHPIITATISEKPYISQPPAPPLTAAVAPEKPSKLPVRKVPGDYGLPFVGPWKDRQDYFYNQGRDEFFKSRILKYQSTVFRTNMPPGPSFPSTRTSSFCSTARVFRPFLTRIELKRRTFSPGLTCPPPISPAATEPSPFWTLGAQPRQAQEAHVFLALASAGSCDSRVPQQLYGAVRELGSDGPKLVSKWVLFHLHPLLILGLPRPIEDGILHTFSLPPFLIKKDYQRLYDFFYQNSTPVLDQAEKLGISRDEACHNLVFATCFNSFGGLKIFFPNMLKWVGRAGVKLHTELAQEIRSVIKSNGGNVTMAAMENMPLMKSVVYEALRIEPPVRRSTPKPSAIS